MLHALTYTLVSFLIVILTASIQIIFTVSVSENTYFVRHYSYVCFMQTSILAADTLENLTKSQSQPRTNQASVKNQNQQLTSKARMVWRSNWHSSTVNLTEVVSPSIDNERYIWMDEWMGAMQAATSAAQRTLQQQQQQSTKVSTS